MLKKRSVVCSLLLISSLLYSMENVFPEKRNLVVYAVPGRNGIGSKTKHIQEIFNLSPNTEVVHVPIPSVFQDIGQSSCMSKLLHALENEKRDDIDILLYGVFEGAATVLNYLPFLKNKNIKAVILESVLTSGNSAMYHKITWPLTDIEFLKDVPGSYYFIPYFATVLHWGYRPGGRQPIKSVDEIRSDIPIIIIHSKNDNRFSFGEACALDFFRNS